MVTSSSELLSLNYLSSGILSPSPRVATVLRTMDPGIGLKSLPQLAQGPMYLHTHMCVCVCVLKAPLKISAQSSHLLPATLQMQKLVCLSFAA